MPFFGTEIIDALASEVIDNPQCIGEHIKKRRMELKLFQFDVAKLLGVCEDTITGWEDRRSFPQIQHYPKLIRFFGYNPFPIDDTTLGGRIKKYRTLHGVSQRKLAEIVQVDETTIRSWEKNLHTPFPKKMKLLNSVIDPKEPS